MEKEEGLETCQHCEYQSTLGEMFAKTYSSLSSKKINVCPGCYDKLNTKLASQLRWLILVSVLIVAIVYYFKPNAKPPWIMINLLFYFLFVKVGLLLHEFGHFACARMLGGYVPKVIIGKGAILKKLNLGHTEWEIHKHWSHGLTYIGFQNNKKYGTLRYVCSILAGPLTNLLFTIIALWLLYKNSFPSITQSLNPYVGFIGANLMLFIMSVYPASIAWLGQMETDGKQVIGFLFNKKKFIEKYQRQYYLVYMQTLFEQQNFEKGMVICQQAMNELPEDPWVTHFYGVFLIYTSKLDEAIELLNKQLNIELVDKHNFEPKLLRAMNHNNLAYALVEKSSGDIKVGVDIMRNHAKKAFEALPWNPSVIQTYGIVMVRTGEVKLGIDELVRSLSFEQSELTRFETYISLGLAYCEDNNTKIAGEYLKKVRVMGLNEDKILKLESRLVL